MYHQMFYYLLHLLIQRQIFCSYFLFSPSSNICLWANRLMRAMKLDTNWVLPDLGMLRRIFFATLFRNNRLSITFGYPCHAELDIPLY